MAQPGCDQKSALWCEDQLGQMKVMEGPHLWVNRKYSLNVPSCFQTHNLFVRQLRTNKKNKTPSQIFTIFLDFVKTKKIVVQLISDLQSSAFSHRVSATKSVSFRGLPVRPRRSPGATRSPARRGGAASPRPRGLRSSPPHHSARGPVRNRWLGRLGKHQQTNGWKSMEKKHGKNM